MKRRRLGSATQFVRDSERGPSKLFGSFVAPKQALNRGTSRSLSLTRRSVSLPLPLPSTTARLAVGGPIEDLSDGFGDNDNDDNNNNGSAFGSLNKQQIEVVRAAPGRVLVKAIPGSGKTRTLVYRISHWLQSQQFAPADFLIVTFTLRAAVELQQRLSSPLLLPSSSTSPAGSPFSVKTFHSLSLLLLRQFGAQWGAEDQPAEGRRISSSRFGVCDEERGSKLIAKILQRSPHLLDCLAEGTRAFELRHGDFFRTLVSRLKSCQIPAQRDRVEAYVKSRHSTLPVELCSTLVAVYCEYEAELAAANALDLDDLLVYSVRMLEASPTILRAAQESYKFILVDEWQDTSDVQHRLIELLSQGHHNLTCVGDPRQSIYGWRNANLHNFERLFSAPEQHFALSINYRSTRQICSVAKSIVAVGSHDSIALKMESKAGDGDRVTIGCFDSARQEEEWIVDSIARLHAQTASYANVAVLSRTHALCTSLAKLLKQRRIPYRTLTSSRATAETNTDRDAFNRLMAVLRVFDSPADLLSVYTVLGAVDVQSSSLTHRTSAFSRWLDGKRLLGLGSFAQLAADHQAVRARRGGAMTSRGVHHFESDEVRAQLERDVDELFESTKACWQCWTQNSFLDALRVLPGFLGLSAQKRKAFDKSLYCKTLSDVAAEIARDPIASASKEAALSRLVLDLEDIEEVINTRTFTSQADELFKENDPGYVSLLTLHGSKGLEFDAVFIKNVENGVVPSSRAVTETQIDEERRLLYVGVTRARKQLFISYVVRDEAGASSQHSSEHSDPDRELTGPRNRGSRFLDALPPAAINFIDFTGMQSSSSSSSTSSSSFDYASSSSSSSSSSSDSSSSSSFSSSSSSPVFTSASHSSLPLVQPAFDGSPQASLPVGGGFTRASQLPASETIGSARGGRQRKR